MNNRRFLRRRSYPYDSPLRYDYEKRFRHATRPGYGMGMGKNTLIHKGKKP